MIENDVIYAGLATVFFQGFASLILMFLPVIAAVALLALSLTIYVAVSPLVRRWYYWIKRELGFCDDEPCLDKRDYDVSWVDLREPSIVCEDEDGKEGD